MAAIPPSAAAVARLPVGHSERGAASGFGVLMTSSLELTVGDASVLSGEMGAVEGHICTIAWCLHKYTLCGELFQRCDGDLLHSTPI